MEIRIEGLSKIYKNGTKALDQVDVVINDGMFGLLGPNGAGKSTLIRILVTLMKPSAGKVTVNGMDLQKDRKQIRQLLGYLPQDFSTFPKVHTWEFLDYAARLAGLDRSIRLKKVDETLERVGLYEARDRLASKLSGGMKRRLGIAQALIGDPKILIVDEPTTGLDPEERIRFRGILSEMSREERIIILSTHIVGDISSTCEDMAVLNEGKIGFNGPPEKFVRHAKEHTFIIKANEQELNEIKEKYAVIATMPAEYGWSVEVVAERVDGFNARKIEPNLEHAYVYFMDHTSGGIL